MLHYRIVLTEKELPLYANDVDITHLKIELQMLPDFVKMSNHRILTITSLLPLQIPLKPLATAKCYSEVYQHSKIFFTFPITTATAERTFSALRCLKTNLQSTLTQPNLNHLHAHTEPTEWIDITQIAKIVRIIK